MALGVYAVEATSWTFVLTSACLALGHRAAEPTWGPALRVARVVVGETFLNAFESRRSGLRWALGSIAKSVPPCAAFGDLCINISEMLRGVGVAKLSRRESKSIIRDYFQESIPLVSRTRRPRNELWQTYRYDVSPTRPEGGVTGRRVLDADG